MSVELGVLTKEQTAYMDSSCGMDSWGEQSVGHLEISVRYKPFSVNIIRYQSLRKSRNWRFFASVEMKREALQRRRNVFPNIVKVKNLKAKSSAGLIAGRQADKIHNKFIRLVKQICINL